MTQICFVDMPFGHKTDPQSGTQIDFDRIYHTAIKPAVEESGLACVRGDHEETGGIIHRAMFARLLLSEFVIADLTTANANVFYELGVRHAARPYTTIPIFATVGMPPFDVNMVRAIPYELDGGKLSETGAIKLKDDLKQRIQHALDQPVTQDSPLFQLFNEFPGIEVSHELTDVFMDRARAADEFQNQLTRAVEDDPVGDALMRVKQLQNTLGDLKAQDHDVLMRLFLTYRKLSAWRDMIELYMLFPAALQDAAMAIQQYALALNRRAGPGDREQALTVLKKLLSEQGANAETYGIMGRIYKDLFKEASDKTPAVAAGYLDQAIKTYTQGFESEPADYYPGINAITLLAQKGDAAARKEIDRLTPLVSFAVARRGGGASEDYWDLATVLELAAHAMDESAAIEILPRALVAATEGWMCKTTHDNLALIIDMHKNDEDTTWLEGVADTLLQRADELDGVN